MRLSSLPVTLVLALGLVAVACGPGASSDDDGGGRPDGGGDSPDAYQGTPATLSGRVWFPNQAPGQAAPGEEIPVFGAQIYLSVNRPPPIPQTVYCERCDDAPAGTVYSSHDGSFQLIGIPGTYWLVIQKAQFRLEQQITLGAGDLVLPASQTTLPSHHDPDNGAWIPRIAIALGSSDQIEDVLGKAGLGEFNTQTNRFVSGGGEVDVYNYGTTPSPGNVGVTRELFTDLARMRQYHLILFPCSTSMTSMPELSNETYLQNIRRYVNEGGKLYVTDWSGEAMDRPFPPQIRLGDPGADSVGTYDPQALTGTLSVLGDADGSSYTSNDAEVVDGDLNAWLGLQFGPAPNNPTPSIFNPNSFQVTGNWNWIAGLTSVQVGVDDDDLPIYDDPKTWVVGSRSAGGGKNPLSVTFEPTGCGRVMYSTYQTANGSHRGLYPQERVLLYLIMEIGVCQSGPIVN
jgi:hypothetical protein